MANISIFQSSEVQIIQQIAYQTWPDTFKGILSTEQIEYMLNWMYNLETLKNQMLKGHVFFGVKHNDKFVGFAGVEAFKESKSLKLHKLYVLPDAQGLGFGLQLFQKVEEHAQSQGLTKITLNVNRFNASLHFYTHQGMTIVKEENIDIGNGFWMEDFVLEKEIHKAPRSFS